MKITFSSTVIITNDFNKMKSFYQDILHQEIELDFGNCISFKNGISLWQLSDDYTIVKKLGTTYSSAGNQNMEICFETNDFEELITTLPKYNIRYLHETIEENWGQRTIRFYDPENNLIEIGESIPCFVLRFFKQGMSIAEVSQRTSVPIEMVRNICNNNNPIEN